VGVSKDSSYFFSFSLFENYSICSGNYSASYLPVIFFFLDCRHRHHSSPEMHGTITGTFKNQIDWIPLNTGSVRPTQGKSWYVSYIFVVMGIMSQTK